MRTTQDVITFLAAYIKTKNSLVNSQEPGKVVKDLVVDAPAQEFGLAYQANDYVGALSAVETLRDIVNDANYQLNLQLALNMTAAEVTAELKAAVDGLADNYQIVRGVATYATGIVRFYRSTAGTVSIAAGTTVSTAGSVVVTFQTLATVSGAVTFDPVTGLYYIDSSVRAQLVGVSGNVQANTITLISPSIADVTSCNNLYATSGGTDEETNDSVLDRIKSSWAGRNLNTIAGYKNFAIEQTGVSDAYVVDASNVLMLRPYGVDIYVLGKIPTPFSQVIAYVGTDIVLAKQPVTSITSIVGVAPYVEGVDFDLVKDTGAYALSIYGQDKIQFIAGHEPGMSESLTIVGVYDVLPSNVQAFLDIAYADGINHVVSTNVVIKQATEVLVDMTIQVVLFAGYDLTTVQNAIIANLNSFLNGKILGESIAASDLVVVIEDTPGVDRTIVPFTRLCRDGSSGYADPLVIQVSEYARFNECIFI